MKKGIFALTIGILLINPAPTVATNIEEPKDLFVMFKSQLASEHLAVVHLVQKRKTPAKVHRIAVRATVAGARLYALNQIGSVQFSCLDKLWYKESHWNPYERYFSAYGIPQAVPGYKMASKGADWRTNPVTQVKWGLSYIRARYGTACNAWHHSQVHNWY